MPRGWPLTRPTRGILLWPVWVTPIGSAEQFGDRAAVVGDRDGASRGVQLPGRVDPQGGVDRGVEVGDRDGPIDDRPGEVVGRTHDPAGAEAAAGEQGAEGGRLVAPAAAGVEGGGAAELGGD